MKAPPHTAYLMFFGGVACGAMILLKPDTSFQIFWVGMTIMLSALGGFSMGKAQ